MVLVDKALLAVKNGDYTKQRERTSRSVPEADIPSIQSGGGIVIAPGTDVVVPAQPIQRTPVTEVTPTPIDESDYDEIRRLIREYEQKIEELKKKLPK